MPEQPMHARTETSVTPGPAFMIKPRLASALRTWVPTAVLLALAIASSLWLAKLTDRSQLPERFTGHAPDLTMEEFQVTTMGEDGNPLRRLSAAHMAHYTDTRTKELTRPHLVVYQQEGEPWHIASERGWVSADNEVLMLLGKVDIWRNYPDERREIHIETEDLRVLPREEYAETELPVTISTPESLTRGTGMRAYLRESRVQLLSKVKTKIEPAVR
jgi:lipopolysaccharide export system protein LptC